ncbi:MAG: hypothetical protein MUF10_11805 [Thermoanaerobaculaceae bacterium]|nr:hypothetical protein [Thermoanaerobaculaceae bacterium]
MRGATTARRRTKARGRRQHGTVRGDPARPGWKSRAGDAAKQVRDWLAHSGWPLVLVACASLAVVLVFVRGLRPAVFWDTESFLAFARGLRTWDLPPLGLRTPGYPAFLIFAGGEHLSLDRVMAAQLLLWICTNCLLCLLLYRLTGSTAVAILVTLPALLLFDALFMAVTLYSETLALCTVTAASLATVTVFQTRRTGLAAATAALLWTGACLVRPIFLAALGAFLAVLVVAAALRVLAVRAVLPALVLPVLLLGSYAGYNYQRARAFQLAVGNGLSLLNYVGHHEIYERLPDSQSVTRRVFEALAREKSSPIAWWDSLHPLQDEMGAGDLDLVAGDLLARQTALRAIRAVPGGYATVWWRTITAFLTEYNVVFGFFETQDATAPQAAAKTTRLSIVWKVERFWRMVFGVVAIGCLLVPMLLLVAQLHSYRWRAFLPGPEAWAITTLYVVFWAVVLANTLNEPWPGQSRYRLPLEHLELGLLVASIVLLARGFRSTARSTLAG